MKARLLLVGLAAVILTITVATTLNLSGAYSAGFTKVVVGSTTQNIAPPAPTVIVTRASAYTAYLWALSPTNQNNTLSVVITFANKVSGSVAVYPATGVNLYSAYVYTNQTTLAGNAASTSVPFTGATSLRIDLKYLPTTTVDPSSYVVYISVSGLTAATNSTLAVK